MNRVEAGYQDEPFHTLVLQNNGEEAERGPTENVEEEDEAELDSESEKENAICPLANLTWYLYFFAVC